MHRSDDALSLVSVVVIGYNQQDLAPIAITGILKQTHKVTMWPRTL